MSKANMGRENVEEQKGVGKGGWGGGKEARVI